MMVKNDGKVFGCGTNEHGMCGCGWEEVGDNLYKITLAPYNFGIIKDI